MKGLGIIMASASVSKATVRMVKWRDKELLRQFNAFTNAQLLATCRGARAPF